MNILVTGGAGFIGSHLVESLIKQGHCVSIIDNFSSGKREWLPQGINVFDGDIRDPECWDDALADIEYVVHLAAMSRSGPSLDLIEECQTTNVDGTLLGLKKSKEFGIKKFVYSASSTHYGNGSAPQQITDPPDLLNPYGLTKHVAELWALLFDRVYGLPTISLRFFNVYGPRQPQYGPYGLVLGHFLHKKANHESLEIHGDGNQRRDFIHVYDIVNCLELALLSDVHGQAFNVGSGTNISILELAKMISTDYYFTPRRAGDAEVTLSDISETINVLGWRPQVTLSEGIEQLLAGVDH